MKKGLLIIGIMLFSTVLQAEFKGTLHTFDEEINQRLEKITPFTQRNTDTPFGSTILLKKSRGQKLMHLWGDDAREERIVLKKTWWFYLLEGHLEVIRSGKKLELKAGSLAWLKAGDIFTLKFEKKSRLLLGTSAE